MALDFKDITLAEDLFLPVLVQQVFDKYHRTDDKNLSSGERAQLFTELTALLGKDLLERALRLLDEWTIIIYYTPDRLRKIVELASKRNSAHVVRIFPGINYCKCRYFQRCVLQLKEEEQDQGPRSSNDSDCVAFTCEHVLAQRLHQLLIPVPREQILTVDQFRYFNEDIYVD